MNTKVWKTHIFLLKSIGLWPTPTNQPFRTIFWLHFTGTGCLLIIFELTSLAILANDGNFIEFVKTLGTTPYHIIGVATMVLWLKNFPLAMKIYEQINRESFAKFCACKANGKFVRKSFAKAEFWSRVVLASFVFAATCSLSNSYVGVCLFPERRYNNETGRFLRMKPYESYTFLNLEKVIINTKKLH